MHLAAVAALARGGDAAGGGCDRAGHFQDVAAGRGGEALQVVAAVVAGLLAAVAAFDSGAGGLQWMGWGQGHSRLWLLLGVGRAAGGG